MNVWFSEAGRNGAFPLDDRSPVEIMTTPRPQLTAPRNRYVYFPDTAPVSEWQAVNTKNRSFVIARSSTSRHPARRACSSRSGPASAATPCTSRTTASTTSTNFVGAEEQMVVGTADVPTGENLILSASFEKEGMEPTFATGTLSLYHGETKVGEDAIKTQLGAFSIAGSGLFVGRQGGEPVTDDYPGEPPYAFTGGTIDRIAVDVSGEPYVDLERQAEMLLRSQ